MFVVGERLRDPQSTHDRKRHLIDDSCRSRRSTNEMTPCRFDPQDGGFDELTLRCHQLSQYVHFGTKRRPSDSIPALVQHQ